MLSTVDLHHYTKDGGGNAISRQYQRCGGSGLVDEELSKDDGTWMKDHGVYMFVGKCGEAPGWSKARGLEVAFVAKADEKMNPQYPWVGRDAQPALVIGRHYVTERDSAPVQYNGIA